MEDPYMPGTQSIHLQIISDIVQTLTEGKASAPLPSQDLAEEQMHKPLELVGESVEGGNASSLTETLPGMLSPLLLPTSIDSIVGTCRIAVILTYYMLDAM